MHDDPTPGAASHETLVYPSPAGFENHRSQNTGEPTLYPLSKNSEESVRSDTRPEQIPQQDTDRRLLAEVAQGKSDAFALLYDRFSGPLYHLCLRMTGEATEAEHILQESFLIVWRKAQTYDPALSSVFGWIVHLTRHKAIDHLRSRGRRPRVIDPAPGGTDPDLSRPLFEPAATVFPAPAEAERNDQAAYMRQALGVLPTEQRQAIEMAFFSDLSHHEISARLEQSLGTIKARIRRGLLKLRDGLRRTP